MDTNTDTKALFIEARRLYNARDYAQALPKLGAILEREPDNVPALLYSADILCEFRHWHQSLSVAQKALAIEPKNPILMALMSKILYHLSDFENSTRYAKRAYKIAPQLPIVLKCYVSTLHHTKDAAPLIAKAAPRLLATKDVEGDNVIAAALESVGKIPEAIRALRTGIRRFLALIANTAKSPPPPRSLSKRNRWTRQSRLCLQSKACSIR